MYHIEHYDMVTSTNDIAKVKALAGAPQGTVILARGQTAGRGQQGRRFVSPMGSGLYMSIVLRPDRGSEARFITTRAAVAVARAIEKYTGRRAEIKWVNDIILDGKKVCGILTEGKLDPQTGDLEYAILGIGINLVEPKGDFPKELRDIAGSVFSADEVDDLDQQRITLAETILQEYFGMAGNHYEEYASRSLLTGRTVSVMRQGTSLYRAEVVRIEKDFGLTVRRENGAEETLYGGDVSVR